MALTAGAGEFRAGTKAVGRSVGNDVAGRGCERVLGPTPVSGSVKCVGLRDVAEAAGVSVATVSLVLSGNRDRRISAITCDRVRAAAESVGYVARPTSSVIRAIGLLLDVDGDASTGLRAVEAVQDAARSIDLPPVLIADAERCGGAQFALKSLVHRGADALIYFSKGFRTLSGFTGAPWRSVFVNCAPGPAVSSLGSWSVVAPNELYLAESVTQGLIRQGHTRLLLVARQECGSAQVRDWAWGMRAEASTWAPAARVEVIERSAPEELFAAVSATLGRRAPERPTAVVALDPDSAAAVQRAASNRGLVVPEDLRLVVTASGPTGGQAVSALVFVPTVITDLAGAAVEALSTAWQWRAAEPRRPREFWVRRGAPLSASAPLAEDLA